jgi:hypothetical protein
MDHEHLLPPRTAQKFIRRIGVKVSRLSSAWPMSSDAFEGQIFFLAVDG